MVKPLPTLIAADSIVSRQDGRGSRDFRQPVVMCDLIGTCHGSASARLGNTFVLAGVRALQEVPSRAKPDAGELQVKVELTPLASATRHGADSRDLSSVLTHKLQEQLCTASFLDTKTLCLQAGKSCWHILVDLRVLNDDGGLLDACLIAAAFALKFVQVPDLYVDKSSQALVQRLDEDKQPQSIPLQIHALSLGVSFGVNKDELIVDPSADEEQILASHLTVCCNTEGVFSGIECSGCTEVTPQLLNGAMQLARERVKYIVQSVEDG